MLYVIYTALTCVGNEVLYFQQIGPRLRTAIETQCRDERTWTIKHAFSRHQMGHLNDLMSSRKPNRFLMEFLSSTAQSSHPTVQGKEEPTKCCRSRSWTFY